MNPVSAGNNPSLNSFATPVAVGGPLAPPAGKRRIWLMQAANGSTKDRVTNPAARTGFQASDVIADDMPSSSITNSGVGETIAFESNSRIDTSDLTLDFNIWSLPVNSPSFAPAPTPTPTLPPSLYVNSFTS